MLQLLGAVLGVVIGAVAASSAVTGGFIGLLLGAGAGVLLDTALTGRLERRMRPIEDKIDHIYQSLGDIHFRLKALEETHARADAAPALQGETEAQALEASAASVFTTPPPNTLPDIAAVLPPLAPAPAAEMAPPPSVAVTFAAATPAPAARNLDLPLPVLTTAPKAETEAAPLELEPMARAAAPMQTSRPAAQAVPTPDAIAAETSPARGRNEAPTHAAAPGFIARLFAGNVVAKAGVVILFFGVGFLLKYAHDHSILPPWTRLLGVAVASGGLFYAGRRLLETRRLYAVILMGCGVGFLYLDIFFALRWYHYIGATFGFALFMALGVATVLAAVRMDARALAVLGLFGAFLAPPLASTGGGSHIVLFSYYTLLNLFILGVSWFKAWRELNLVGFGFTFLISLAWGAGNYQAPLFASVEPFVVVFFLIYLAIPVLFATRQKPELRGLVDGTLVFGTPIACAFLQARVVAGMGEHALAWSAGLAGALYTVLGLAMRRRPLMALLAEAHLALAVLLLTMAVFFALDAYPTFALWTLEGAAIVWVGLRQQRRLARAFGLLLQVVAAFYFLGQYPKIELANPLFNDFVFGCALVAVAAWITAGLMDRRRELLGDGEIAVGNALLLWGWLWWFGGGLHAIYHDVETPHFTAVALLFASGSLGLAELVGAWLRPAGWPALRRVTALLLIFMVAAVWWPASWAAHPLQGLGGVAWPVAFAVHFWVLHRQRRDALQAGEDLREVVGWLLLALLATWDAGWLIAHGEHAPALLWALGGFAGGWLRHTFHEQEEDATPMARAVLAWSVVVWGAAGGGWLESLYSGAALVFLCLAGVAVSTALFEICGRLGKWMDLRRAAGLLLPAMLVALAMLRYFDVAPLAIDGWWAWPLAFAAAWGTLWRQERDECVLLAGMQHVLLFWMLAGILLWQADSSLHQVQVALQWLRAGWGAIPAVLVLGVTVLARREAWPWRGHAFLYRDIALAPLLLLMGAWSIFANLADPGRAVPSFHLPLLNPLDLTQALVLLGAWIWAREADREWSAGAAKPALGAAAFIWINGMALRAIHYYAGVPYEVQPLLASVLTQSVLSLLWTACALVLMTWASRRNARVAWSVGAALLGVVVLKLVLNDLGNSGTVARIVSFLGVGAMLLLIGYMAPLPPGDALKENDGRG